MKKLSCVIILLLLLVAAIGAPEIAVAYADVASLVTLSGGGTCNYGDTLVITASGAETYEWHFVCDGEDSILDTHTAATLELADFADSGIYYVVAGGVNSNRVTAEIKPKMLALSVNSRKYLFTGETQNVDYSVSGSDSADFVSAVYKMGTTVTNLMAVGVYTVEFVSSNPNYILSDTSAKVRVERAQTEGNYTLTSLNQADLVTKEISSDVKKKLNEYVGFDEKLTNAIDLTANEGSGAVTVKIKTDSPSAMVLEYKDGAVNTVAVQYKDGGFEFVTNGLAVYAVVEKSNLKPILLFVVAFLLIAVLLAVLIVRFVNDRRTNAELAAQGINGKISFLGRYVPGDKPKKEVAEPEMIEDNRNVPTDDTEKNVPNPTVVVNPSEVKESGPEVKETKPEVKESKPAPVETPKVTETPNVHTKQYKEEELFDAVAQKYATYAALKQFYAEHTDALIDAPNALPVGRCPAILGVDVLEWTELKKIDLNALKKGKFVSGDADYLIVSEGTILRSALTVACDECYPYAFVQIVLAGGKVTTNRARFEAQFK